MINLRFRNLSGEKLFMEIIQPRNAEDLAGLIKLIDPQTVKFDLSANKGITLIDKDNLTVTVKTGSTWRELISSLKESRYEPCIYPKTLDITLEEWIQTDGLNLAGIKFGPTGRSLYDIEIVTYQGKILNLGFKTTLYDALGYELKRIFLGSQKTLGITTECIMQIRPLPEFKKFVKIPLPSQFNIKDLMIKINKKSLVPTLMFLDPDTGQQSNLYLVFDGISKLVESQLTTLKAILSELPNLSLIEISESDFSSILYKAKIAECVFYFISSEQFGPLIEAFKSYSKAYVIDRATLLIAVDLKQLGIPEETANKTVLGLKGKKAYINPVNQDELLLFGDKLTFDLIQKIRTAFNSKKILKKTTKDKKK